MKIRTNVRFLTAVLAACIGSVAFAAPQARAAGPAYDADVLIQAGHEGRPDCNLEPAKLCNNTGAVGELSWTPVVANETARILRAAGFKVLRKPAFLARTYRVRDAIFIHFDGSPSACHSKASVGYPNVAHSREAAQLWKKLYSTAWPYGFQEDNFTDSLREYYGYKHVDASDAELVIEGGELTCVPQRDWIGEHLLWESQMIAHLVSLRLGRGNIPAPPPH
jgi:hypothetical protein